MLSKLFGWFRVGEIECDPRLEAVAERVEESMASWSQAMGELMEEHKRQTPPQPMRRVK